MKGFLVVAGLLLFCACAEKEFDPADPQKSFGIAKEPYDDENYERAITRLGEFKSRFPYSQYAIEAELLVANSHFELGHFAEAAASYEQFVKLHPKHPKVDFAMYRVGECYWSDAPEDIDREQDYTNLAVEHWEKLVEKMPQSPYSEKARKFIAEGKRRMAESLAFIANFYCRQEIYHACAYRFIKLTEQYPQFADLQNEAYTKAAKALDKVADAKAADPSSDKNLYFKRYTAEQIRALANDYRKKVKS